MVEIIQYNTSFFWPLRRNTGLGARWDNTKFWHDLAYFDYRINNLPLNGLLPFKVLGHGIRKRGKKKNDSEGISLSILNLKLFLRCTFIFKRECRFDLFIRLSNFWFFDRKYTGTGIPVPATCTNGGNTTTSSTTISLFNAASKLERGGKFRRTLLLGILSSSLDLYSTNLR